MLAFYDRDARGTRRTFLRVGGAAALGAAGLDLAAPWGRAEGMPGLLTGKSVIFLFLHGGPSQVETFDPKMDRPEGIRSATGEVATALPGVTFGGTFPNLAARADRLTIVRSFVPGDADHNLKPLVGRDSFGANPGALLARVAGPNHPRTGLPTNVVLFPRAVDPTTRPGTTAFGRFEATGPLSSAYAPFDPGQGEGGAEGLTLRLPRERLDDRRHLQALLGSASRHLDATRATEGVDRLRDQAYRLLEGGIAEAFDLTREPLAVRERYGDTPFARSCLLARRLVEDGVRFVTVYYVSNNNQPWDTHQNHSQDHPKLCADSDRATAALITDLKQRGLLDDTLVVWSGEYGRTP
jgi:hypothetical protein